MPDERLAKTRATLPKEYRFGDAKYAPGQVLAAREVDERLDAMVVVRWPDCVVTLTPPVWRAPHENAAVQLKRNAIEDAMK